LSVAGLVVVLFFVELFLVVVVPFFVLVEVEDLAAASVVAGALSAAGAWANAAKDVARTSAERMFFIEVFLPVGGGETQCFAEQGP